MPSSSGTIIFAVFLETKCYNTSDAKLRAHSCCLNVAFCRYNILTRPLAIQKDGAWYSYVLDLPKNITEVYGTDLALIYYNYCHYTPPRRQVDREESDCQA